MDDLLMPAPPGEMPPPPGASGMGGGMMPPPPPADAMSGGMPMPGGPGPEGMPDPMSMALAAVEVTMEMLPEMPDQALSALSSSVMAEMDRRSGGGDGGMGMPPMPAGGGMGMPPMPPAPAPAGGIGALVG